MQERDLFRLLRSELESRGYHVPNATLRAIVRRLCSDLGLKPSLLYQAEHKALDQQVRYRQRASVSVPPDATSDDTGDAPAR